MKTIVIYQSGTGFTAKYAGWIAGELGCEAKAYKSINPKELSAFDLVVYGGWIMGGMVVGYDKLKALNLKQMVVFGVGMSAASEETAERIAGQNQIERERFFYLEGGYNPKKLGFFKRMMMNLIKKSLERKQEKTAEDLYMLKSFEGADHTDKGAIQALVEYCRKL